MGIVSNIYRPRKEPISGPYLVLSLDRVWEARTDERSTCDAQTVSGIIADVSACLPRDTGKPSAAFPLPRISPVLRMKPYQ